jgi:hypothetical protein
VLTLPMSKRGPTTMRTPKTQLLTGAKEFRAMLAGFSGKGNTLFGVRTSFTLSPISTLAKATVPATGL